MSLIKADAISIMSLRVLIIIAAIVATLVSLAGLNEYLGGGGDNASYVAEAQSYLRDGKLRDIFQAGEPEATLRPPLFPILCAWIFSITGSSLLALKAFVCLSTGLATLASGAALWIGWNERTLNTPKFTASSDEISKNETAKYFCAILTMVFALTPTLQHYSHDVLSDVPFSAMALLAIAGCGLFIQRGGVGILLGTLAALIVGTLLRSACLFISGSLFIYVCTYLVWPTAETKNRTLHRRIYGLLFLLITLIIGSVIFSLGSGSTYMNYPSTGASGGSEFLNRILSSATFYLISQPAEIFSYAGLQSVWIFYLIVLGTGLTLLGIIVSWQQGQRLVPVVWLSHQFALLAWPFVDARLYLPTLPLYIFLLAQGIKFLIETSQKSRIFLPSIVFGLLFLPVLGCVGTWLQLIDPESILVDWASIFTLVLISVFCAWLIFSTMSDCNRMRYSLNCIGIAILLLLTLRVITEEIIPERIRGPAPSEAGYPDLYDASIWLKENASPNDLVVSSKLALVWHWSGLQGIPIPKVKDTNSTTATETLTSARWAIVDGLKEDQVAHRYLVPLLQSQHSRWKVVWQQGKTHILYAAP